MDPKIIACEVRSPGQGQLPGTRPCVYGKRSLMPKLTKLLKLHGLYMGFVPPDRKCPAFQHQEKNPI